MKQDKTQEKWQLLFNRLLKSLRYARMSADFLATIAQFTAVQASGLLPAIMTQALWRRGNAPRVYPVTLPASRVKAPDRISYNVVFTTHFSKGAIEVLQQPGDRTSAPLSVLHGLPLYVDAIQQMYGRVSFVVFSDFIRSRAKAVALDTPGEADWGGQDDDGQRCFDFAVVRGSFGGVEVPPKRVHYSAVAGSTTILCACPWRLRTT